LEENQKGARLLTYKARIVQQRLSALLHFLNGISSTETEEMLRDKLLMPTFLKTL